MKKQSALVLIGLLILIAGMAISHLILVNRRRPRDEPPSEDPKEAFTWFDTLGFPDVKGRPFVRVATGRWYQYENDPPRNTYVPGFLLEDTGDTFSVLTVSLATETFRKTPAKTAAPEQVGYEVLDLVKEALPCARGYAMRSLLPLPGRTWSAAGSKSRLHPVTEVFVLAWACRRNGLDSLADELCAQAARIPKGYGNNSDKPFDQPLRRVVADDLARVEMWRGIEAFEDPVITRAQLLERFERFVKNYPDSEYLERARETVTLLRQMVKENAEHAEKRRAGKPFEQLSKQEQIAELIFQLRDQDGRQISQPGYCSIFDTRSSKEDSPAHRLVALGYDAVPQLIDALGDRRLTRSVGFQRDFYFSHHVLRVGDCAEQILSRIAGRTFFRGTTTNSAMIKDGEGANVKAEIQAWWAELQKKGEKRFLIEAVERGDRNAYNQACRLLERYPDAALPAIIGGVKAAGDRSTRNRLVEAAAKVKGDAPIPFLLTEVKDGPYSGGRLAAAWGLHERGRPEGMAAMIAEWNSRQPGRQPKEGPKADEGEAPDGGLHSVAEFLAGCGRVEAIKALGKNLDKRPIDLRLAVVEAFAESGKPKVIFAGGTILHLTGKAMRDNPKAVQVAIDELLVTALDDTAERFGAGGMWYGMDYSDPRICDVAGHLLSRRASQKYRFDSSVPLAQRDRNIIELKNLWRKAQGQPPLPLPMPRTVLPVPDKKLQPLLDELLRSRDADRQNVERQIEQLGLGTLPGVLRRLEKTGKTDDPNRAVLDRLARRLACIVTEVVVAERSLRPDPALAARLKAMTGKPFDPRTFIQVIDSLVRELPNGAHGFRFSAERSGDGTGFTLKVDLLDEARAARVHRLGRILHEPPPRKGELHAWHHYTRVTVGGKGRYAGGNGAELPTYWVNKGSAELQHALADLCSTPIDQPIEVCVQLIAEFAK